MLSLNQPVIKLNYFNCLAFSNLQEETLVPREGLEVCFGTQFLQSKSREALGQSGFSHLLLEVLIGTRVCEWGLEGRNFLSAVLPGMGGFCVEARAEISSTSYNVENGPWTAFLFVCLLFLFCYTMGYLGSLFPNQGWNPLSLH